MSGWRSGILAAGGTIRDAIAAIDEGSHQIALVTDEKDRLIGTVSDGDVRRAILRGVPLTTPVTEIVNTSPTIARTGDSRDVILALMKKTGYHRIPVIDENGRLVGLETIDDLITGQSDGEWVVLMAGGLGTRLRPFTEDTPKPLLEIGNKPLLETILDGLIGHGFGRFFISVNYRAKMITDYFGDGSRWGVDIRYIEEGHRMGTGGALSLLPEQPDGPILVMNGDLLTNVNFRHLFEYHRSQSCSATLCVREYETQIPYGVVDVRDHRVADLREKPSQRCFINAGIYVLQPDVVAELPKQQNFDMPFLIDQLISNGKSVAVFPIREFWLDIGRRQDFLDAQAQYSDYFS